MELAGERRDGALCVGHLHCGVPLLGPRLADVGIDQLLGPLDIGGELALEQRRVTLGALQLVLEVNGEHARSGCV